MNILTLIARVYKIFILLNKYKNLETLHILLHLKRNNTILFLVNYKCQILMINSNKKHY